MKKILITGVYGFLGSSLFEKLSKKFKVYGIGTNSYGKKNISNHRIIKKKINYLSLKKNFSEIDYIIHCAGPSIVEKNKKKKSNIEQKTLEDIFEYIKKSKSKPKLIYISSVAVYGDKYKKKIKEQFITSPISLYAKSKLKCENVCKKYFKKYNFSILILRVSSLYGIGLKKQIIHDAIQKIINKKNVFFGTGEEVRNFLHIRDFINLIEKIIQKDFQEINIYNCGGKDNFRIKDVLSKISKILNKKIKPNFNKKYKSYNPRILRIETKKIKKHFDWKPKINFTTGLKDYYLWYKKIL